MDIKAIETQYKGYRFRSRTEARWAVFFDTAGIEWEYEKEGYDLGKVGRYLPDFWLPSPNEKWPHAGYWLEIKGLPPTAEEEGKAVSLATYTRHTVKIAQGLPGEHILWSAHRNGTHGYVFDGTDGTAAWSPEKMSLFSFAIQLAHDPVGDIWGAIDAARSARFEHGEAA